MCGVIGLVCADKDINCASQIYEGLNFLQHRGQDAAGIVTCSKGRLFQCKGNGMVRDVFTLPQLQTLKGDMGIGHVRYPTAGSSSVAEAQPFYVNSPFGLVLGHNGNLTNSDELATYLKHAHRHLNTNSDSEILLNVLAHNLSVSDKLRLDENDVFTAVAELHKLCSGGYAVAAMITGYGMLAFRDPHGIRPLIMGECLSAAGTSYCVSSESVVLDFLQFQVMGDIAPGEAVLCTMDGNMYRRQCHPQPDLSPCIFEFVYFARPDSVIDGISVYQSRLKMGEKLAEKILREYPDLDVDVVMPVPDTSCASALQLSQRIGKTYREGFVKNRYVGRTFIMPGQKQRRANVRRKLNTMNMEFKGKKVLLVDDSIVRGTTSSEIVLMAREAGAVKVYVASAAPPVRFQNVYGIDMPSRQELVAHNRDADAIAKIMGADGVIYQDLPDLVDAVGCLNADVEGFDTSVFDGKYIAGALSASYLNLLEQGRSDESKQARNKMEGGVESPGLHNFNTHPSPSRPAKA